MTNALNLAIGKRKAAAVPPGKAYRIHDGKTDLDACLKQAESSFEIGPKALEKCRKFAGLVEEQLVAAGLFVPIYWSVEGAPANLSFVVVNPTNNRFVVGTYRLKAANLPGKVRFSVFHGNEQVTQTNWKTAKVGELIEQTRAFIENCVVTPLTITFPEGSFRVLRVHHESDHGWTTEQRIVSPTTTQMWYGGINMNCWSEPGVHEWNDLDCILFVRGQKAEMGQPFGVAQGWAPQNWKKKKIDLDFEPIEWMSYGVDMYEIEQEMSEDIFLAPLPMQS